VSPWLIDKVGDLTTPPRPSGHRVGGGKDFELIAAITGQRLERLDVD
jgi:hypothetical protein